MSKQVIKFYADWCGPCKIYSKTFDKVKQELDSEAEFLSINVETDTSTLGSKYRVRSIPFTVVVDGDKFETATGNLKEEELKQLIADL